jgi:hypothetical protein
MRVNYVRTSSGIRTPLGKTPPIGDLVREGIGLAYPDEPRIIPVDGEGYFLAMISEIIQSPSVGFGLGGILSFFVGLRIRIEGIYSRY